MIVAIHGAAGGSLFEYKHGDELTRYNADNLIAYCLPKLCTFLTGDFTFIHVLSKLLLPFCNRHVVIVYY